MDMDHVDELLTRIGDYTPDVQHYAIIRQRLRREFGGLFTNQLLWKIEEVIDEHLHRVNIKHWESLGFGDGDLGREWAFMEIDEKLFKAGAKIHGNNLVSSCILHAAVLRQAGICETMFEEFKTKTMELAEAM